MKTTIGATMVGVCALVATSLFAGCEKVPFPGAETSGSGGAPSDCAQKGGLAPADAIAASMDKMVKAPEDVDPDTEKLGIAPRLMNPALATSVDLSPLGVSGAVYVPVQISKAKGGRTSVFYLAPGKETVTGYYVADGLVWKQTLKRLTGDAVPALAGDEYELLIQSLEGEEQLQAKGKLLSFKGGRGEFSFDGEASGGAGKVIVTVHYICSWFSMSSETVVEVRYE